MAKHNHGRPDALQIQVGLKVRAPKGSKISGGVLKQILDRAVNGEQLPPGVEFSGIVWRNPNRRGALANWRYHTGANLDKLAQKDQFGNYSINGVPVEGAPRGSLQEAVDTLAGALYSGTVTF